MFYRRKIILALLQLFDGQLEKIRLQKLLFLFTRNQVKTDYDFIPYRFGCFSYSANADIIAMISKGILNETKEGVIKTDETEYLKQMKVDDKKYLLQIKERYGAMSSVALMKHTYLNYPFYATKSEVAEKLLSKEELKKVKNEKIQSNTTTLFTIGYEGISLEEYLLRLIKNDVKALVDVRNNPLSMKYGFSKTSLKRYCESVGVQYFHFPEVGIRSEQRQELNSQADYDKLFSHYRENNLNKTEVTQKKILDLLIKYQRIALTCFEANICQCHRKPLAEAIESLPNFIYEVKHI